MVKRLLLSICALLVLMAQGCADVAYAQVPGAPGRTTAPGGASTSTFSLAPLGTLTCSGMTCSATSSSISPTTQSVSGTLAFNSTHDATVTIGGSTGGGAGVLEVSCDGGSTWLGIAVGSGSVVPPVSYSYATPHCSGVTNLDTLLFRTTLSGGGGSGFNMSFATPSSVTISW